MDDKNKDLQIKEIESKTIKEDQPEKSMTYDELLDCVSSFFNTREYTVKESFKLGYTSVVGEDYTNSDLLVNLCEIIYNHLYKTQELSKTEKRNMKSICTGLQQVMMGLQEFDNSTRMDTTLISQLTGYLLKINRNYFHDRHR